MTGTAKVRGEKKTRRKNLTHQLRSSLQGSTTMTGIAEVGREKLKNPQVTTDPNPS